MENQKATGGILIKLIFFKGFALLLTGLVLVFFPQATLTTLMVVIGVYWFFDGISTVVRAVKGKETNNSWGLFSGILGIVAGLLILSKPYLTAVFTTSFFMWFIGVSALIYGTSGLFSGIKLPKNTVGRSTMIFGGIISVIFGFALISSPYFSALTIIYIIGTIAIIGGVSILFLGRNLQKKINEELL